MSYIRKPDGKLYYAFWLSTKEGPKRGFYLVNEEKDKENETIPNNMDSSKDAP